MTELTILLILTLTFAIIPTNAVLVAFLTFSAHLLFDVLLVVYVVFLYYQLVFRDLLVLHKTRYLPAFIHLINIHEKTGNQTLISIR